MGSRQSSQQQIHNAEHQRQISQLAANLVIVAEHVAKTVEASFDRMSRWKDPPPPPPVPPPPPDHMSGINTLTVAARDVLLSFINRHQPGTPAVPTPLPPIAHPIMADTPHAPAGREESELLGVITSLRGQPGKTPAAMPSASASPQSGGAVAGATAGTAGSEVGKIRDFILTHFKSREKLEIMLDQLTPDLLKK